MAAEWVARQGSGENVHQAMLSSGGRVNASNCRSLWEGVVGGVPATVDDVEDGPNGYLVRNSVMESFTQHNPVRHTTPDHARPRQATPGHATPCHTMPSDEPLALSTGRVELPTLPSPAADAPAHASPPHASRLHRCRQ